jgi:flagellar FliJ protein
MKKFKFRLEKMLQLKLHNEKEKQKILAEASQKVFNQEEQLENIQNTRHENQKNQRKYLTGAINRHLLSNYSRYYLKLKKEELTGTEMLKVLEKEREEKRGELVEATRARKIYEKLKERTHEKYYQELERALQKEQDEISSQMFHYNKRLPA